MNGLPPATREWIREQYLRQQRDNVTIAAVRRECVARWRAWEAGDACAAIPGYETCPPDNGNGFPAYWTLYGFITIREAIELERQLLIRRAELARRSRIPTRTNHGAPILL